MGRGWLRTGHAAVLMKDRWVATGCSRGAATWGTRSRFPGKLQQQPCQGKFATLQRIPMFESDFIRVNKRGGVIDAHNSVQMVTVGITYTSPHLTMPYVQLLSTVQLVPDVTKTPREGDSSQRGAWS